MTLSISDALPITSKLSKAIDAMEFRRHAAVRH